MNIVDELFAAKKDGDVVSGEVEEKVTSLIELIDENL